MYMYAPPCEAAAYVMYKCTVVTHRVCGLGAPLCTVPTGAYCIVNYIVMACQLNACANVKSR